ncbi:Orn/Lys/Arg family decarboxylase [Vulcanisaeta sp. JCM 14467]
MANMDKLSKCVELLRSEPLMIIGSNTMGDSCIEIPLPTRDFGSHFLDTGLMGKAMESIGFFFNGKAKVVFSGSTGSIRCVLTAYGLYSRQFKKARVIAVSPFHKSIVDSMFLILNGREDINIRYVGPSDEDYLIDYDMLIQPGIFRIKHYINNDNYDNTLIIITSPTYGGVYINDDYVNAIKTLLGDNALIFIDNAWGLGKPNIEMFDVLVRSSHKVDGGPRPISLIISRNDEFWNYIRIAYSMLESTSPLVCSLFETERIYRIHKKCDLAGILRELGIRFIDSLKDNGLKVLDRVNREGFFIDPVQININTGSKNGYDVHNILLRHGIIPVRAGPRAIEILISIDLLRKYYDNPYLINEVSNVIAGAIDNAERREIEPVFNYNYDIEEDVTGILNRRKIKFVDINESLDAIAAAPLVPYPPGVPVVIPGAVITKNVLEYIKSIRTLGGYVINVIDNKIPIYE